MGRKSWGLAVAVLVVSGVLAVVAGPAAAQTVTAIEGAQFSGQVVTGCVTTAPPTIAWGDGTTSAGTLGSGGAVSGTHTYTEDGTYKGSVSGCASPEPFTADVADAPLSATGSSLTAVPGQTLTATVTTFTDADPGGALGDYSATIAWGDGSQSSGTITAAAGSFAVTATHTYTSAGRYAATVAVNDVGGSQASAQTTVNVSSTAPPTPRASASFTMPSGAATPGTPVLLDASGSHANGAGISDFVWTVRGPGVIGGTASATCGGDTSQLQTSFAQVGIETITLRVTDSVGLTTSVTHALDVGGSRKHQRRGPHVSQWFLCTRGLSDPAIRATLNGGPPTGCQDQAQYGVGLIEAIGCWEDLKNIGQIPTAEYNILCPHLKQTTCLALIGNAKPPPALGMSADLASARGREAGSPVAVAARVCPPSQCYIPPFLLATSEVRVNGLDITPAPGAAVLIDVEDGYLISSNATISLLNGKLTLRKGFKLDTSVYAVNGDIPVLDTNLGNLVSKDPTVQKLVNLGGFILGGTLTVDFTAWRSQVGASITLPSSFTNLDGSAVTSRAYATADNTHGLVLDDLVFKVPSATFGKAFGFDKLAFCYQADIEALYMGKPDFCAQQTGADFGAYDTTSDSSWNASGEVNLLGVGLDAAAPPPTYGIGFVDGNFVFGGAELKLPPAAGIPIGSPPLPVPAVSLTAFGGSLGVTPTRFTGTIGLTAAQVMTLSGSVFVVFPSTEEPYTFTGTELALGAGLTLPTPTATNFAFAAGGDVGVTLPAVGTQTLAGGYVMYIFPDYLAAGGNIHFDPFNGWLVFDASIAGQFAVASRNFELEATGEVKALKTIDLKGDAVMSNVGLGVCGTVSAGPFNVSAGVGYRWGDSIPGGINFMLGSCDLTPYKATVQAAHDAAAGYSLRVGAGLPSEMVKVIGVGGAPNVTITGPDGVHASITGPTPLYEKPFVIYPVPAEDTTYIGILGPAAGRYTVTADPGSPAISQLVHADGLRPRVAAHVIVHNGHFRLRYTTKPEPGQRVTFFERAGQVYNAIGSTTAARGTTTFTPAPGRGATRQIVAEITENGAPVVVSPSRTGAAAYELVLTNYHAPGPRRLGRVHNVRVHRAGTRVLVNFSDVRGARRYALTVKLSSGLDVVYLTKAHTLTIPGVFGEITGRIAVQALGDGASTRTGPAGVAAIPREQQ